ncbi:hypothetical protein WG907_10880 [Sphingobium sp. AN558]|uniref:hypothetical protein n=1 Tax=Sphingobium sp. AN558 TaxID=3133442 RepID=UPI0030BC8B59
MHGSEFGSARADDRATSFHRALESRSFAIRFGLAALVLTQLSLFIHPIGFMGGPSDDQRYLDIALDWWRNGPSAGSTHWALRVPLIAAIDLSFHIAGPGLDALLAVPRFFYALFVMASSIAMARWTGRRAACIWLALVIVSPVLHKMATSCFPEIVELSMGTLSLVAFIAARREPRALHRLGLLALSGLALGVGIVTRETIGFLALGYIWAAIVRPGMPRRDYLVLGGALALPIAADIGWLWWQTGDPLYRLHVGENHIHIFSAHLRGGVYTGGSPFLNPDLASRWIPAGPTKIFWPINPIGDFLIDPDFGFVALACGLVALPFLRRGQRLNLRPYAVPLLIAIALGCYLTVTWIFTLRPQPRYYLPVVAATQVGLALALGAMMARPDLKRRAIGLFALVLIGGVVPILVARPGGLIENAAVGFMRAHPGTYAAPENMAARLSYRSQVAGLAPTLTGNPPPGGYRLSGITSKAVERAGGRLPPSPGYRDVALVPLERSWIETIVQPKRWRALRVERRER